MYIIAEWYILFFARGTQPLRLKRKNSNDKFLIAQCACINDGATLRAEIIQRTIITSSNYYPFFFIWRWLSIYRKKSECPIEN